MVAGRDLLAMDAGGTSDPYCKIAFGDEEVRTQTIMKTVNPAWNEDFVLCVNTAFTIFTNNLFSIINN